MQGRPGGEGDDKSSPGKLAVDEQGATMAAILAYFPLVLARNVQTRGAAHSILLEADPAGIAVGNPILRIPPEWCLLGLAGSTCLGLVR